MRERRKEGGWKGIGADDDVDSKDSNDSDYDYNHYDCHYTAAGVHQICWCLLDGSGKMLFSYLSFFFVYFRVRVKGIGMVIGIYAF